MKDPTKRQITKIAREAEKLVIHTMKETGIGSGEFDLIHYIRHNPGTSQKDIAKELNMDKGAVARRTAGLERKGYLVRKKNPNDGRSSLLYATDKAENLKLSKASVETAFYSWLTQELPPEERDAFLKNLDTLYWRSKKESRSGFPNVSKLLITSKDAATESTAATPQDDLSTNASQPVSQKGDEDET